MGGDACSNGVEKFLVLAYVGLAVPLPLLYFVGENHLGGGEGGEGREGGKGEGRKRNGKEMGKRGERGGKEGERRGREGWKGRRGGRGKKRKQSNRIKRIQMIRSEQVKMNVHFRRIYILNGFSKQAHLVQKNVCTFFRSISHRMSHHIDLLSNIGFVTPAINPFTLRKSSKWDKLA